MQCKSYSHFFSKKFQHIYVSLNVNFNESLTNDIVSFEQLGPGLSVQEMKLKTDFQDGHHDGNLGFLVRTILDIVWSTCCLNTSYQVLSQLAFWFRSCSKQIFFIFSSGGHLVLQIGIILAILVESHLRNIPLKYD